MIIIPTIKTFDLPDSIYQKCDIDVEQIDNIQIVNLDTYLIYFRSTRPLIYNHLKLSDDVVKLSELHQLYHRQDWSNITNETALSVLKHFNYSDDYTFNLLADYRAMFFDRKRLNMFDQRFDAIKRTEHITQEFVKHWSCDLTMLHTEKAREFNVYHVERLKLLEQFYAELFSSIDTTDVHVNYLYDRIEVVTPDNYVIRIMFLVPSYGYVNIDVCDKAGQVGDNRTSRLILCKCSSRHKCIGQIIEILEKNVERVHQFSTEYKELENVYSDSFLQSKLILNSMLTEMKSNDRKSYIENNIVKFVQINTNSIIVNTCRFHKNERLGFSRTVHYIKDGMIYRTVKNIMHGAYNIEKIDDIVTHLLRNGTINVYRPSDKIHLDDYLVLINKKTIRFDSVIFRMTYSDMDELSKQYFVESDYIVKDRYTHNQIDSELEIQERLSLVQHEISSVRFMNYFEGIYKRTNKDVYDQIKSTYKKLQYQEIHTIIIPWILKHGRLAEVLKSKLEAIKPRKKHSTL